MAHDVFLSYSDKDKAAAYAVRQALERNRIRVWMAPRDVIPGAAWAETIMRAIKGAKVMVLLLSGSANESMTVRNEVKRAVDYNVAILPVRIENVAPHGSLELHIGSRRWLDAITQPFEQHLERLARAVKQLLEPEFARRSDAIPPGPAEIEREVSKPRAPTPASPAKPYQRVDEVTSA
jgi:hypothetical protein